MIRRILLPIDCSEHSLVAARYAAMLARIHDAVIYALGVVDVPGIVRSSTTVGAASHYGKVLCQSRLDDARKELAACLDRVKAEAGKQGVKVKRIHESGPVHEMIAQHSRNADLVVVAEHINFEFETAHKPGNTLFRMLQITSRLVLVVPDALRSIKRVLVAHDLSPSCARVLYMLVHLNPFPGAEFVVVHADHNGMADQDDFADIVGYIREHGHDAEMVVRNVKPSRAILEVAREREVDCIVLGAYDVGKVERLLFGSTAKKILDRADIPLLFGI